MKAITRVFLYELWRNGRRKGYLFSTVGLPLIGLIIFFAAQVYTQTQRPEPDPIPAPTRQPDIPFHPIGLVDLSQSLAIPTFETGLIPFRDEKAALAAIDVGAINSYYVISKDYMQTGEVTFYFSRFNLNNINNSPLTDLIRRSVLSSAGKRLDPLILMRLESDLRVVTHKLNNSADTQNPAPGAQFNTGIGEGARFILVYLFALTLMISTFATSGYLMQSIVEEKETRMIEVLMSSMRSIDLLAGKILAMGALGLAQMILWAGTGVFIIRKLAAGLPAVPTTPELVGLSVSGPQIALLFIYFILTYLMFASLFAGIGAISNSMREGPQLAGILTLPAFIPLWATSIFATAPDGPIAVILSMFPLTAPLSMIMRVAVTDVPPVQLVISLGLLTLTVLFSVWLAARLFRVNTLLSGQVPKLSEIPRLIRESL